MMVNQVKQIASRLVQPAFINSKWIYTLAYQQKNPLEQWSQQDFVKRLSAEIISSQKQLLPEDQESKTYFKQNKWKIHFNEKQSLFNYIKIQGHYDVRVLTHVKENPPNEPTDQEEEEQQQDMKQTDQNKFNCSQVIIFIKKKDQKKWLVAQMGVYEGSVQLLGVFFSKLEPGLIWQRNTYAGPVLQTLPHQLLKLINQIFLSVGLSTELIMNMVIHSAWKVDEIDVKWLQNLRDILD